MLHEVEGANGSNGFEVFDLNFKRRVDFLLELLYEGFRQGDHFWEFGEVEKLNEEERGSEILELVERFRIFEPLVQILVCLPVVDLQYAGVIENIVDRLRGLLGN